MKDTTYNRWFGASGAVSRPKVCANLKVYLPSEYWWKPRLRQTDRTIYDTNIRTYTLPIYGYIRQSYK